MAWEKQLRARFKAQVVSIDDGWLFVIRDRVRRSVYLVATLGCSEGGLVDDVMTAVASAACGMSLEKRLRKVAKTWGVPLPEGGFGLRPKRRRRSKRLA